MLLPTLEMYLALGALRLRGASLRATGELGEALARLERGWAAGVGDLDTRNDAVNLLVSAGAYQAALRAEPPAQPPRAAHDALELALIQVNLAEAEYNLGRWADAEARLFELDEACAAFPITRAGLLQQRAWILAHTGRAEAALALCERVRITWLPLHYHAEHHFTRAAALLGLGQLDDAEAATRSGSAAARRTASQRNATILLARVAAARADWPLVERRCRAAAEHPFRGQGGDGLLLWGDALRELGRENDARAAWKLCVDRDPESESARHAAEHLASTPAFRRR